MRIATFPIALAAVLALAACATGSRSEKTNGSPGAGASSPVAPSATAIASASPSDDEATIARPRSVAVRPFVGSQLIEAFAAARPRRVEQADAAAAAAFAARTSLACDDLRREFSDDFAVHRNVGRLVAELMRRAKPMGYASADLDVSLGNYDFGAKRFTIGSGYGDGSQTFGFSWHPGCQATAAQLPDGSRPYQDVSLEADDGAALHEFRIDTDSAERVKQSQYTSTFVERLVFYPVSVSRGDDGQIRAVVHVTKMQVGRRPAGSPNDDPAVLMTRVFP